jgi:lipoic acid synthetase
VTRDDLPDGGAAAFAATLSHLRRGRPDIGLEILTPDFHRCQEPAVAEICAAVSGLPRRGLVWGHNMETVPRLYRTARKGADYDRSLRLLALAADQPDVEAKSVLAVLGDLRDAGVTRIALGQYLRPTRHHLPVQAYLPPEAFTEYAHAARDLGFSWVNAGPLVRSSYHAEEQQQ